MFAVSLKGMQGFSRISRKILKVTEVPQIALYGFPVSFPQFITLTDVTHLCLSFLFSFPLNAAIDKQAEFLSLFIHFFLSFFVSLGSKSFVNWDSGIYLKRLR